MLAFCLKEKQPHFLLLLEFQKLEKMTKSDINLSLIWEGGRHRGVLLIWGHLSCQSVKIPTKCKTRSVPAFFDTQPKSFFYKEKSFVQAYWTVFLRGQRRIYCHVASLLCQWFHSVAKYSVHLLLTFEKLFELKSSIFFFLTNIKFRRHFLSLHQIHLGKIQTCVSFCTYH